MILYKVFFITFLSICYSNCNNIFDLDLNEKIYDAVAAMMVLLEEELEKVDNPEKSIELFDEEELIERFCANCTELPHYGNSIANRLEELHSDFMMMNPVEIDNAYFDPVNSFADYFSAIMTLFKLRCVESARVFGDIAKCMKEILILTKLPPKPSASLQDYKGLTSIAVLFSQLDLLLKESNDSEYNRLYDQYQSSKAKQSQENNPLQYIMQDIMSQLLTSLNSMSRHTITYAIYNKTKVE